MKTILNTLLAVLFLLVTFPGLCFFAAVLASLTGLASVEQASELAGYGFRLYGLQG